MYKANWCNETYLGRMVKQRNGMYYNIGTPPQTCDLLGELLLELFAQQWVVLDKVGTFTPTIA